MKESEKLVSVLVVCFNSSEFIVETLNSIKNQTYKNLELIVTDDCSTDDTVEICKSWFAQNTSRFNRVKLVTSETNTGIPKNCNRGLKACSGEWIKLISGDDLLCPNAISDYMTSISKDDQFVFAKIQSFSVYDNKKKTLNIIPENQRYSLFDLSAKNQNKVLCEFFFPGCSPSIFVRTETSYVSSDRRAGRG